MFICGEIALDALNTLILKSRYLETFFWIPTLYERSHSTVSRPPPPFQTDNDVNVTRVTPFQRRAQREVALFAVGNDKVKLPL